MRYKLFGRSGLRVSELALGTMTFGEDWGWGAPKEECRKIFNLFIEAGGNFIDTANNYTNGSAERFVGEFIGSQRDYFVVATKYTLIKQNDDPNAGGNHRKNMMRAVEHSLRRLNTDYIDLYWLHIWDHTTPVDEVMRGLDDLVRAGKILYIGISDTPAWIVAQANTLAELRGWTRFVGYQGEYNLARRDVERDILPMAKAFDMAFTPWGLLAAGGLTGKYNQEASKKEEKRMEDVTPRIKEIAAAITIVAEQIGRPPAQVAIKWVAQQQQRAQIIPIIGARRESQMRDNLGILDFSLDAEHLNWLENSSRIDYGFPHDMIERKTVQQLIYGDNAGGIDNHRA